LPTSTTRAELEELVEAPAAYTPETHAAARYQDEQYTLLGPRGGTWLAVQRIRLRDVDGAVTTARRFMAEHNLKVASWWLSERSTPHDVEERLLARGLRVVGHDYLVDGMLATSAPPAGPPEVEARAVRSVEEYVAATAAQWEAFDTPADRRDDPAANYELERRAGVLVLFAAWLDGSIVGAGRAIFTPRGVLLSGGATIPKARGRGVYRALVRARWDAAAERGTPALAVQAGSQSAPILARLGFEQVCRFRRLEDVASPP
jgi:GNAT superfamily N-acetyltransferase